MRSEPEISFHNIGSSDWAKEEIQTRIAKLEKKFDRLLACRVRVDQRQQRTTGALPPVVRIEMEVPGHKDLVVSYEPKHLQQKFQRPDLHNAIHEAFRIAEDQLAEYKKWMDDRSREPLHAVENQSLGQVADLPPGQDFGFILTKEGGLLYFHRNSLLSGDFARLTRGTQVYYIEEAGDTGPIASKVRVKA